jgi:hypothetical protein
MREVARALGAVALAYAAMMVVAAAGLGLIGVSPGSSTVAAVALAGGGAVDLAGSPAQAGPAARLGASVHGSIHVLPLGVSLTGAVIVAVLLRRRARSVRVLVTTVIAAPLAFTLPALAGHGRLTVASPCAHRAYGLGGCQSALGGITVTFHTDVGRTVLGGLAWTLVVLALTLLSGGHVRLPDWVRPAVTASVSVLLGAALAGVAAGLLLAVRSGPEAAGAALLAGPNVAFAALTAGIGVPWSAGPASHAHGTHGLALLISVLFAVAVLAAAGVLTAARTPAPAGPAWRRGLTRAGRSALTTGILVAGATAVAGGSARLSVAVLGMAFPVIVVRAAGDILVALVLGPAAGAVAGLAGGALLEVLGRRVPVWRRRRTW